MGQPIWGQGQPIQGPIQRRFGLSRVCKLYFKRESTEFHDIQVECQRIKLLVHYLLYFLFLISCKQLFDLSLPDHPKTLPYHSSIAPGSYEAVQLNLFLTSHGTNLKPPSNIAFPTPVPSSVNESSKIFFFEDPSG